MPHLKKLFERTAIDLRSNEETPRLTPKLSPKNEKEYTIINLAHTQNDVKKQLFDLKRTIIQTGKLIKQDLDRAHTSTLI